MEKLTLEQEISLLEKMLESSEYINNGSSRTVFTHPESEFLAIKIAVRNGGKQQNSLEIATNQLLPEYTNTIHAFGRNIIVCDLITEDYFDEVGLFLDYHYNDWYEDEPYEPFFEKNEEERILKIVESLENTVGYSQDNLQIGLNEIGRAHV